MTEWKLYSVNFVRVLGVISIITLFAKKLLHFHLFAIIFYLRFIPLFYNLIVTLAAVKSDFIWRKKEVKKKIASQNKQQSSW